MLFMGKPAWILFLIPFLSFGDEVMGPVPGPSIPPVQIPYKPDFQLSIPMPGGAVYMSSGIYASLAGGKRRNYGDTNGLYQWQGEMGYFYTPWFSSGSDFKMIAGQPSDPVQVVKNRFFVFGRFHKSWSQVSAYAGAQVGMEDLNISLSPLKDSGDVQAPLRNINAGMGLELGLGWKFSRYVGLTLGQRLDASFVGEDTVNFEGSVNFRTAPGLALDILAMAPSMRSKVKALFVYSEAQFGQLALEDRSKKQDFAWVAGMTIAF